MLPNIKRLAVLSLLFIFLSAPAYPVTPIYMWNDSNGVTNFGDDPSTAPAGAKVAVWSEYSNIQDASETELAGVKTNDTQDPQSRTITQGAFAIQLVKELGLRKNPSPREASEILSNVRIAPPLGHWFLSQPMTPGLTLRLRKLSVAAARERWIEIPEDQSLLAFDTAAAILGLNIPVSGPLPQSPSEEASSISPAEPPAIETPSVPNRPEDTSPGEEATAMPTWNSPEVIYSTYPILAAPLLFTFITPLPAFYPYYTWYPIAGGFWCNNYFYTGYYVLNANRYFYNHYGYHDNRRLIGLSTGAIGGQVQSRIIDGQFQNLPNTRQIRFGLRSMPATNRILNPPSSPNRSFVSRGGFHTYSIQSPKTYFSPPVNKQTCYPVATKFFQSCQPAGIV